MEQVWGDAVQTGTVYHILKKWLIKNYIQIYNFQLAFETVLYCVYIQRKCICAHI
jgi:hypothetical protein